MAETLSPVPRLAFLDNNGNPLVGGKLFTYGAGTTTKIPSFSDAGGTLNTNPVILDFRGECNLWIPPNVGYKYVLAPANDTDPPTAPIFSVDNIKNAQLTTLYGGVDTGSGNAYVLNFIANFDAYEDGIIIYWVPSHTNTGPSTMNVNGLGVVDLLGPDGSPLFNAQVRAGVIQAMMFFNGAWQLILTPNNTGTRNSWTAGNADVPVQVTDAATTHIETALGNVFEWTIGGNRTVAIDDALDGSWIELYVTQDGTGNWDPTWPANVVWLGGQTPVLTAAPGSVDKIDMRYLLDIDTWFADFSGNFSATVVTLNIAGNAVDVDAFALAGSPAGVVSATINVATGAYISASSPATPALNLAGFASGSAVTIVNKGYILGAGGAGGNGGLAGGFSGNDPYGEAGRDAGPAGPAILGPGGASTLDIDNGSGFIWGGGGGGGGGGATSSGNAGNAAAGGGGGGGAGSGIAGQAAATDTASGSAIADNGVAGGNGRSGDFGTGGAGDETGSATGGDGGDGGTWGAAGSAGTAPTGAGLDVPAGTGGTAGKAIELNGGGAPTFLSGGGAPHVKGAIS